MDVTVDNDFARFGAKSYAINKITSVEVRQKTDGLGCSVIAWSALTVGLVCASIGAPPVIVLAALFGYMAFKSWKRSQRIKYQLFVITSAAEAQAYESYSRDEVFGLRDRIEAAMVDPSRRI